MDHRMSVDHNDHKKGQGKIRIGDTVTFAYFTSNRRVDKGMSMVVVCDRSLWLAPSDLIDVVTRHGEVVPVNPLDVRRVADG